MTSRPFSFMHRSSVDRPEPCADHSHSIVNDFFSVDSIGCSCFRLVIEMWEEKRTIPSPVPSRKFMRNRAAARSSICCQHVAMQFSVRPRSNLAQPHTPPASTPPLSATGVTCAPWPVRRRSMLRQPAVARNTLARFIACLSKNPACPELLQLGSPSHPRHRVIQAPWPGIR